MSKSEIGKLGWNATTERWFFGKDELHKNWLSVHARGINAEKCSRMGKRIGAFSPRIRHPKSFTPSEFWFYFLVVTGEKTQEEVIHAIPDSATDAIEACLTGNIDWVRPYPFTI